MSKTLRSGRPGRQGRQLRDLRLYDVIKGEIVVFRESGGQEISLATLRPDDISGEMVFLNRGKKTRSESVRAVEDSEVEAWHLSGLSQEYAQMSPIIKYIIDEILTRSLLLLPRYPGTSIARNLTQEGKYCHLVIGPLAYMGIFLENHLAQNKVKEQLPRIYSFQLQRVISLQKRVYPDPDVTRCKRILPLHLGM